MEVKKENVLAAYETAREAGADSTMKVLEALFGKEVFKPKDITERIKTFEDACKELGEGHPFVRAYTSWIEHEDLDDQFDILAYFKLRIICAALNEGWKPEFLKEEYRYYPWFWLYTRDEIERMDEQQKQDRNLMFTGDYITDYAGFACASSNNAPSAANTYFGSRLCLKSEALAVYCGKQFIDLWADFNLVRRR